jgi:hypothetical protein
MTFSQLEYLVKLDKAKQHPNQMDNDILIRDILYYLIGKHNYKLCYLIFLLTYITNDVK